MSQLTNVYSIVTRLPPAIDGVGDYALNLARQLRKDFNIQTHFIVGNSTWQGASEIEGFPISQVLDDSANNLVGLLSGDRPVLLHYVGYGYAKRGCPVWLVDGLQRWKSLYPQRSLVTMFHEIYASSDQPWESSFWLSPIQKNLATRLIGLSVYVVTSKQSYADILKKLSKYNRFEAFSLPVFSTIGEPRKSLPLSKRNKHLVVFGHKNSRKQVYELAISSLQKVCENLQIEKIIDIGVPTELNISHKILDSINVEIVEKGVVDSLEISDILNNSVAGFLYFPPPSHLAKSTIFAAYCAHGLIPCVTLGSEEIFDNLVMGKHYFVPDYCHNQFSLEIGQNISDQAYLWYQNHSLNEQAKFFSKLLA